MARLHPAAAYADGQAAVDVSYRDPEGLVSEVTENLVWANLRSDFDRCVNTYQEPVLTEFAALGLACILCASKRLEITEVTRRGEKVDYWLGDREALLEVSGTTSEDLDSLCERKASEQLQLNPMGKNGYVCAAAFHTSAARLWFYARH